MKNGRSLKLSKNTLLAILTAFAIQMIFGVNFANAMPCELELDSWHARLKSDNYFIADDGIKKFDMTLESYSGYPNRQMKDKEDLKINLYSVVETFSKSDYTGTNGTCADFAKYQANRWAKELPFQACIYRHMAQNNCDPSAFRYSGAGQKGNVSSSSSSQTNSSSSNNQSSSSDDERIKKINEVIDQFNSADKQKDYVNAFPALQIIANSQDNSPSVSAQAISRLAEYYKFGFGVPKDEIKAQALFEKASKAGHKAADGFICENYLNGTGGVTQNHQTALKYCTSAANNGDVTSMGTLGYLYYSGTGTQNQQLGNEWICKAALKGEAISIKNAEKLKLNCN